MPSSSSGQGAEAGPSTQPLPPGSRRASGVTARATSDPVLRNTLRYTISAREYALLHRYILSRSRQVKKRVPSVETVNRIMNGDPNVTNPNARRRRRGGVDVGSTSAGTGAGAGAMVGADDYNARAVRHSLRVFGVTASALKLYGLISERFLGAKRE